MHHMPKFSCSFFLIIWKFNNASSTASGSDNTRGPAGIGCFPPDDVIPPLRCKPPHCLLAKDFFFAYVTSI